MENFKKPLKSLLVSEKLFNDILNMKKNKIMVDSILPYQYGYKDKEIVYYTNQYLVCSECLLLAMKLLEETEERLNRCRWYQYLLIKVKDQEETIKLNTTPMNPAVACKTIKKELKKHYTDEEIDNIYKSHEKEDSHILHLTAKSELGKIIKLNNCVYYDLNGAYASELIKMFPKCGKKFYYWFDHRHDNNNKLKNLFNYFVGCLTMNPETEKLYKEREWVIRKLYPKSRHYIVNNISKKMEKAINYVNGYNVYINTDGFIVQDPQRNIQHSKLAGEFKIEYKGSVYTYRDENYIIFQYGDEIKGNLPIELRDKVDLRSGKVIHFERVLDKDGTYTYKNIKEEIIKIEEND